MISFIVPAYNEADNIGDTVETLERVIADSGIDVYEVIIVDDGSTDGTDVRIAALKSRFPNIVGVRQPTNQGIGCAVRAGLAIARFRQFMVVPADNDMHPELIRLLLAYHDVADMIVTVPFNKEIRSNFRVILSMLYQVIYMITFRVYVNYFNGPGIWPTERARASALRARRFSIIAELNVKLLRSGCRFFEVPGYMQAGPKARRTVTFRNLFEVMRSYVVLVYEVYIGARRRFSQRPERVIIEFIAPQRAAARPERSSGSIPA